MIKLSLPQHDSEPLNILCLGAHADDIEIGCGGTLLYLREAMPRLKFHWVVLSSPGCRRQEAEKAAELFTAGCDKTVVCKGYRDAFFPYSGAEVKQFFEEMKNQVSPDLIFTPWREDAHQDHRVVAELTWNTFRNHLILEYEIPKYDGDMGQPNVFVPLEGMACQRKIDHLLASFQSQRSKPWFEREIFMGLMRLRGMESNAPSGYAEAFHCRKIVL